MTTTEFHYWRRWAGETVCCMASGPSMAREDAEYCQGKAKVIVINSTFRLAPWADCCYSNDEDWVQSHLDELRESFRGQIWCGHPTWRSIWVHSMAFDKSCAGIADEPGKLAWGMNSGAAALNLAYQFGAKRILMLGYDQQWRGSTPRWHGRHPGKLQNQKPGFARWATWYENAAKDFERLGVEVINCSRETSLQCFRRADLRTVI